MGAIRPRQEPIRPVGRSEGRHRHGEGFLLIFLREAQGARRHHNCDIRRRVHGGGVGAFCGADIRDSPFEGVGVSARLGQRGGRVRERRVVEILDPNGGRGACVGVRVERPDGLVRVAQCAQVLEVVGVT